MESNSVYYVVMEGDPVVTFYLAQRGVLSPEALHRGLVSRASELMGRQEKLAEALNALGGLVTGRFVRLANAVRVTIPPSRLEGVGRLPGVLRVQPVSHYERCTGQTVPFVGATNAWGRTPGLAGRGIRIGIIDSGIDYLHANFGGGGSAGNFDANDPECIEEGSFPTSRVVGGYDFAGDDYNGDNKPEPDPDPLDCASQGHGSHVAGIAAGGGVLRDHTAYGGPYTNGLDLSRFSIGPGVAPEAQLYAIRIFGCSGSSCLVLDGVEYASDPNGDMDFSDRLDVVNLSLGSLYGYSGADDVDQVALSHLVGLGCVAVAAAGNNGNAFYVTASPAAAEFMISVASTIGPSSKLAVGVLSTPVANYLVEEADFTPPLMTIPPIVAEVAQTSPLQACGPLENAEALAGRIALIERGNCNYTDKVLMAQASGAVGVIIVNNVTGTPVAMTGTPVLPIVIPCVMISQGDGFLLKARLLSGPVLAQLSGANRIPTGTQVDQISSFSSRGPASPFSLLKPDISAPGQGVFSTKAGSGSGAVSLSGTSMAAPHVAGAAALLRQMHPDWTPEMIKAALMNTAQPVCDNARRPYPESRAGCGRLQIADAMASPLMAMAAGTNGAVALNFGFLELTSPTVVTQYVLVRNLGMTSQVCQVTVSNTVTEKGFLLEPISCEIFLGSNATELVAVRMTADPSLFDRSGEPTTPAVISGRARHQIYEASGSIWINPGTLPVKVPFYACLRAGAGLRTDVGSINAPSNRVLKASLPLIGKSAHPSPVIALFQLGYEAVSATESDPGLAVGHLMAVGASSDLPYQSNILSARVFFGLACATNWTSPGGEVGLFHIDLDTNLDGTADFILENNSMGGLTGTPGPDDVFVSSLLNYDGARISNSPLNVFSPDARDTAAFNNSVLVMSCPAQTLGLAAGNGRFSYRVRSEPASQRTGTNDQTSWIQFDAARPVVNGAGSGIGLTPFQSGCSSLSIVVDGAVAGANGLGAGQTSGLLVLHPFNRAGDRFQVVRINSAGPASITITEPVWMPDGGHSFSFSSEQGVVYTILSGPDPHGPFVTVVASGLVATPPLNRFTNTAPVELPVFYRVRGD